MGSCFSTGTTTTSDAVNALPTAKVITVAGDLREYATPAAASDVLGGADIGPAACCLCSSDRLYCDEYIPALDPEELLQPGQIYFVLPAAKLRYPLSGEDMAALAVKASSALGLLSERGGQRKKKIRIMPAPDLEGDLVGSGSVRGEVNSWPSQDKVDLRGAPPPPPGVVQRKMKRNGSMRARVANYRYYKYSRTRLSSIPELAEQLPINKSKGNN